MRVFEALKDMIVEFTSASTGEGIGRAHLALVKRFGFETNLIVDMSRTFDSVGEAIVFSGKGRQPLHDLNRKQPLNETPVAIRARANPEPFLLSDLKRATAISDEVWWTMLPAHLRGLEVYQVPVYDGDGLKWFVACGGPSPDLSWRVRSILSTAAHAAYARWRELVEAKTPNSPLTPREAECLRFVSVGKSDEEIGSMLGISPRTVRFHVGNAKAKLGVSTRIQAVAKRLGAA